MLPLDLDGRLDLEFNSERLALVARGKTAILTLPAVRCGWKIYRSLPGPLLGAKPARLIEALVATDLQVNVAVGGRVLLSAGAGHTPSRLMRLLGLPPVTVHWGDLARSLLQR